MKKLSNYCLLLLGSMVGCISNPFSDGYKDLGTFDTKVEAQNQAVAHILSKYNSLPDKDYKVLYNFRDARPGDVSRNALWYNKNSNDMAIEVDINSGAACRWSEVGKIVLEQASRSSDSMIKIDSLSKPNQPTSQCLK